MEEQHKEKAFNDYLARMQSLKEIYSDTTKPIGERLRAYFDRENHKSGMKCLIEQEIHSKGY